MRKVELAGGQTFLLGNGRAIGVACFVYISLLLCIFFSFGVLLNYASLTPRGFFPSPTLPIPLGEGLSERLRGPGCRLALNRDTAVLKVVCVCAVQPVVTLKPSAATHWRLYSAHNKANVLERICDARFRVAWP